MPPLTPLETLLEPTWKRIQPLPLPDQLADLYGDLTFQVHHNRPHVAGNFIITIDGVTSLNLPHTLGMDISGTNAHDRMIMGILRAAADAVIVGAGTLRSASNHIWTAKHIYSPLTNQYQQFRKRLGKRDTPLNILVSGSGDINTDLPMFHSQEVSTIIVTTEGSEKRLRNNGLPKSVGVVELDETTPFSANSILQAISEFCDSLILVEGGPHIMGRFFADECLDELFLTIAPQLAGRDSASRRPGLIDGQLLAPDLPRSGQLVGAKRGNNHLFLRYSFPSSKTSQQSEA